MLMYQTKVKLYIVLKLQEKNNMTPITTLIDEIIEHEIK